MDTYLLLDILLSCYYSGHIIYSIKGYYHIMEPVHIFEIRNLWISLLYNTKAIKFFIK